MNDAKSAPTAASQAPTSPHHRPHPQEARRRRARRARDSLPGRGRGQLLHPARAALRVADGRVAARPLARRNPRPDPGHARLRREILARAAGQDRRRQALHRRRGRQDQLPGRADRRGLRSGRAHDQRARAGPHRRNAGQAGIHSRLSHRALAGRIRERCSRSAAPPS